MVVYLSHAAAKTILQYRSSTEVKLNIVIAVVGILTQDVCPLPVSIESSEIEPEPVYIADSPMFEEYGHAQTMDFGWNPKPKINTFWIPAEAE